MISLLDYGAGNVRSLRNAISALGFSLTEIKRPEDILKAERLIFPGVGEASSAMNYLRQRGLDKVLIDLKQPFLGICLGLQLMCKHSEENDTKCLGIFDLNVKRFPPLDKVPHMGWNKLEMKDHPLFKGTPANTFFYYVHSYYAEIGPETIATSEYIVPFSAAIHKKNFYAIQAHPEKSGQDGQIVLQNFLDL